MKRSAITAAVAVAALALPLHVVAPAAADNISPHVNGIGRVYSKEPPNSAHYGTGMSGRLAEASELRYHGEQEFNSSEIDESIRKLAKAVQLDPANPLGHVLYARAITAKFFANKGEVDEKLLADCLYEWRMLWHHDADQLEQMEAKSQAMKLGKIARALKRKKKEQEKRMLAERRGNEREARADEDSAARDQTRADRLRAGGPSDNYDDTDSE